MTQQVFLGVYRYVGVSHSIVTVWLDPGSGVVCIRNDGEAHVVRYENYASKTFLTLLTNDLTNSVAELIVTPTGDSFGVMARMRDK